jgi:hypothetical protein
MILNCKSGLSEEEYKLLVGKAKKVIATDWEELHDYDVSWKERKELLIGDGWYVYIIVEADNEEDEEDVRYIAILLLDLNRATENEEIVKIFLEGECVLG